MNVRDIIRTDNDRIFMVDPECFIIFTGSSIEDPQPFIRIGNWTDLPSEIIPLIENIIIPDRLIGNPSHEQFNIDVDYLPTNRYIGSKGIVRKYLNYQKIFGLDLKNATVVDAEKDIPEISSQKTVSDRDSFIGIFYSNGNFRINHNGKELFDLTQRTENSVNDVAAHDKLAASSRKTEGSGFFIVEGNPIFFHKGNMAAYLFPTNYFSTFAALGINPRNIGAIIHPSTNFINISKFLKWKNRTQTRLAIFNDHSSDIASIKSLFSEMQLSTHDFTGLNHSLGGVKIANVPGSFNLKITAENEDTPSFAFIKSSVHIKETLTPGLDFTVISYTAFEESSSVMRTGKIPFAVLDDNNPGFAKFIRTDNVALYNETQYRTEKVAIPVLALKVAEKCRAMNLSENEEERTEQIAERLTKPSILTAEQLINLVGTLRFLSFHSDERKVAAKAKDLLRSVHSKHGHLLREKSAHATITLYATGISVIPLYDKTITPDTLPLPDIIETDFESYTLGKEEKDCIVRILNDRKRLYSLLSIFNHSDDAKKQMGRLHQSISKRKKHFSQENLSHRKHKAPRVDHAKPKSPVRKLREKLRASLLKEDETDYLYRANDFENSGESDKLAQELSNEEYSSRHFSLPEGKGLNQLNAVITSTAFSEAWKASKKSLSVKLTPSQKKWAKEAAAHADQEFSTLPPEKRRAIARLNRSLIEITHRGTLFTERRWKIKKLPAAVILLALLFAALLLVRDAHQKEEQGKSVRTKGSVKATNQDHALVRVKDDAPIVSSRSISDQKGEFLSINREKIESELLKVIPEHARLAGWDYEVFIMANRIAISNGFSPIMEEQFGKKNPHWIFPGNIFVLPSGLKVAVEKGDTLWGIAERFLSMATSRFQKSYDKLAEQKRKGKSFDAEILKEAEYWAFMMKDRKALKDLTGR